MTDFQFDERAAEWDRDPVRVERARAVAEAIRGAIPAGPGTRMLEYGCGTGLLSFALQPFPGRIVLADTSQGMLDVLALKIEAARVLNMEPQRLDLLTDSLPEERFDLLCSLLTLHHIPDTVTVLHRFHDVLKPGGSLALADLDTEDGSFHGMDVTDIHRGFDRSELQARLEAAGFTGVRFSTVYTIRKPVEDVEREYPMFLAIARREA
jgi:ubiquinone/menaquinone biosynthesis C-methylase UbiE